MAIKRVQKKIDWTAEDRARHCAIREYQDKPTIEEILMRHAFQRAISLFFDLLTSDQLRKLAEVVPDSAVSERITILAQRASEGELTESERSEYEAYIDADGLVAIFSPRGTIPFRHP